MVTRVTGPGGVGHAPHFASQGRVVAVQGVQRLFVRQQRVGGGYVVRLGRLRPAVGVGYDRHDAVGMAARRPMEGVQSGGTDGRAGLPRRRTMWASQAARSMLGSAGRGNPLQRPGGR